MRRASHGARIGGEQCRCGHAKNDHAFERKREMEMEMERVTGRMEDGG